MIVIVYVMAAVCSTGWSGWFVEHTPQSIVSTVTDKALTSSRKMVMKVGPLDSGCLDHVRDCGQTRVQISEFFGATFVACAASPPQQRAWGPLQKAHGRKGSRR